MDGEYICSNAAVCVRCKGSAGAPGTRGRGPGRLLGFVGAVVICVAYQRRCGRTGLVCIQLVDVMVDVCINGHVVR